MNLRESETHYSVLKCDEKASKTQLKKQFKKLALQVNRH
jgi:curved DNA-binding protein CbpA